MSGRETELLEEAVKWLRIIGTREAREVVVEALSDSDEDKERAARIAYELSNGENSTKEIARHIPYSRRWVSYRQNEWNKMGILEREGPQRPYEHILSLEDLGIEVPDIPDPEEVSE